MIQSNTKGEYIKTLNNAIKQCTCFHDETTCRLLKPINAEDPQFAGLPKLRTANALLQIPPPAQVTKLEKCF